jgi:hypothetical protein
MKESSCSCCFAINVLAVALIGAMAPIRAAEAPPKAIFAGVAPVCPCESLTNVSLPNTTDRFRKNRQLEWLVPR